MTTPPVNGGHGAETSDALNPIKIRIAVMHPAMPTHSSLISSHQLDFETLNIHFHVPSERFDDWRMQFEATKI
jgi:hypothetical protein